MKEFKQITIKNQIDYFDNDMINLKDFESGLLKIDKKVKKRKDKKKMEINTWFLDYVHESKQVLKKYNEVCDGISGTKENAYEKDYMKIKFNSDDDVPLNKPLTFHAMTIIIRSVFEEDAKFYPQVFLDGALYELHV